uniref:Ig-like domain-containing protein n=1 Tax=Lates calcarifer TaxID=8187 RepID=A0A4W6BPQ0_LATCA
MASPVFAFYLTCLLLGKMAQMAHLKTSTSVHQERRFVSAHVGDKVDLECLSEDKLAPRVYWYKHSLGQKPRLISSSYKYDANSTFYHEFNNNPRFTLDTKNSKTHLMITDLRISDSATYYCVKYSYVLEFSEIVTVSVKGSGLNIQALVHQSESETIQPGGSVTLNCTVHTGTCDGEHSVYWFKSSEESHPGLIYTHGDRNDQCERKPNTQTHTCVYNLPMKNLSFSHAGTYYCAVASCGHILFGNGTKLDIEDEVDSLVLLYFLSGALTFTTILSVLLAFLLCKINKRNSCQSQESQARFSAHSTTNVELCQDEDNLHYAALSVNLPNRSRRQRDNTENDCVYSSVKQ